MNIQITKTEVHKDDLLVWGTVNGKPSHGHGWASRINGMNESEARVYLETLLIAGMPVEQAALDVHVTKGSAQTWRAHAAEWMWTHRVPLALFAVTELNFWLWVLLHH